MANRSQAQSTATGIMSLQLDEDDPGGLDLIVCMQLLECTAGSSSIHQQPCSESLPIEEL